MRSFHIWTAGCQMNQADSRRLAQALEQRGWHAVASAPEADLIVVNTCVVRQSAEDRAIGYLTSLMPLVRPGRSIALMGCLVGPDADGLHEWFPHVDLFLRPGAFGPLLERLPETGAAALPAAPSAPFGVVAFVPVIEGCNRFCSYCIVPYRRGRERSRPLEEIACEVEALVGRGVREVTLLGQTVDNYGHDLPDRPNLADLLARVHAIPGLVRIRFLTSHPAHMHQKLIDAVAGLPRVCPHFSLPVQSGDERILRAMGRGYTVQDYRALVARIRHTIPQASLSTDVIVGFPGETEEQFQHTLALLEELRFNTVHVAAYSPRPGTIAARTLADDVPRNEKVRRLQAVEALQERIATGINARLQGQEVEVLVEGQKRRPEPVEGPNPDGEPASAPAEAWYGRSRQNKLVHFAGDAHVGELATVRIERASPWSLVGRAVEAGVPA